MHISLTNGYNATIQFGGFNEWCIETQIELASVLYEKLCLKISSAYHTSTYI
jgi:hypothetical protein